MLVIRLARTGKRKQASFRVVVAEKEKAVSTKFIEILGNYDPHQKKFEIDEERLKEYMKNGARPSNSLAKILKKEKIDLPKWVRVEEKKRPPKEKKKQEDKKETSEEETRPKEKKESPKNDDTSKETGDDKKNEPETEKDKNKDLKTPENEKEKSKDTKG